MSRSVSLASKMKLSCILSVILLASVGPAVSYPRRFDTIFNFGDSFTDTGNGNIVFAEKSIPHPAEHLPYGQTFFGRPTGRSTNGRLIIDFVASKLKLPFVRPFLGPAHYYYKNGTNFAVTGATALGVRFFKDIPIASQIVLNTSSSVQLQWFKSLKRSLCSPAQACPPGFFDNSLFFVGEFGFNDYSFALLGRPLSEVRSMVPYVVMAIARMVEELIKEGATTLVVPGIPPLGCFPPNLVFFPSADPEGYEPTTGCLKEFNELAVHHSGLLQQALEFIQMKYPSVLVLFVDFYMPIIKMVEKPSEYEFITDVLKCCCGGGGRYNFNMSAGCGMAGATVCDRPVNYLFWDSHFTDQTYRFIAKEWVDELRRVTDPYYAIARDSA